MKRTLIATGLLIILVFMLSCSGQATQVKNDGQPFPDWIETGGVEQYPPDLYITGVGSAEVKYQDTAAAQAESDSKAIAQVAKQIEVVIQQLSSSFEREVSAGGGPSLNQRDIWQKTAAYVKIKVEGVRIQNRFHDEKNRRMYTLAVLDRMAQGRTIAAEIATLKSSAAAMTAEAERSQATVDKVHRSVIAYGLAIKKLILAVRKNQYLGIIAPRMVDRDLPDALARLQSDVTQLMSAFSLEIAAGDNQKGIVGGNLPQPLKLRVFYRGQPAPAIPINFSFVQGSGNVDSRARSDANGLAATTAGNLGPTGRKINKIRAAINVYPSDPLIQKELTAIIAPTSTQFTYELPPVEELRVAVLIAEYNLGYEQRESYLKNLVVRSLGRSKLQVLKEVPPEYRLESYDLRGGPGLETKLKKLAEIADMAVLGESRATLQDVSSRASLRIAKARAIVKIFDLSANTEIGSVDLTTKGAGPDRDEAGRRTLKKISVSAARAFDREIQRTLFGK